MPRRDPPRECPGSPVLTRLRRGATLFRIHATTYGGNEFNPTPAASPHKGGRFDRTSPGEAFLYAGSTLGAVVVEALMRDLPPEMAPRRLPFSQVRGRAISRLHL